MAAATHVRFLFGFPFALLFLAAMAIGTGDSVPLPGRASLLWVLAGAFAQIGATALMLQAMKTKSFVVTTAYIKTEPVLVALFGLVVLGQALSALLALAIGIATLGVVLTAWPKEKGAGWDAGAIATGLAAAALFAVAALGFREAIHALPSGGFGIRATTILVWGLGVQALSLSGFLLATDRAALGAILRHWKPSLFAGFMGALASQFWFLGFALATAAEVRTLALVEVLFAKLASGRLFAERLSLREGLGLALIVAGVGLLLNL